MKLTTPTYEHDCASCFYIGTSINSSGELRDWYRHKSEHRWTDSLLARYGDKWSDHFSWNVYTLKKTDPRSTYKGMTVINEQTVVAKAMLGMS